MFEQSNHITKAHRVVLSIGSNIGDLKRNIEKTLDLLSATDVLYDIHKSSFCLTEPYGYNTDHWFMNISVDAKTELDPFSLLFFLKSIEYQFGRKKSDEITDRIIDIDILFYDTISIDSKYLTLPHPRLHNRNFMLLPTNEILPNLIHPTLNKTIETLSIDCEDTLRVIKQ